MPFSLPDLPYPKGALAPHISAETLEYHYGKHHQAYVTNLNNLTAGTDWAECSVERIVAEAEGALFNNAAQVFNHTFYWHCMKPGGGGEPGGELAETLAAAFGDVASFRTQFTEAAVKHFGSGWAWLVKDTAGKLSVESLSDAGCPLRAGKTPLLTCDVWEHAYYIDYRNARPRYIEAFWKLVNWEFVAANLG